MKNYTIKSYTASAKYNNYAKMDECLLDFAKVLFKEGFITISTVYDKDNDEMMNEYSISVNKEERI